MFGWITRAEFESHRTQFLACETEKKLLAAKVEAHMQQEEKSFAAQKGQMNEIIEAVRGGNERSRQQIEKLEKDILGTLTREYYSGRQIEEKMNESKEDMFKQFATKDDVNNVKSSMWLVGAVIIGMITIIGVILEVFVR